MLAAWELVQLVVAAVTDEKLSLVSRQPDSEQGENAENTTKNSLNSTFRCSKCGTGPVTFELLLNSSSMECLYCDSKGHVQMNKNKILSKGERLHDIFRSHFL